MDWEVGVKMAERRGAPLVFVDCPLGLKEGKMKGSTKPERMDEP